ncbi:hypothetical protein F4814DRAFT_415730 [Daldinia grandis]|nr:hypothetical protein F4814DRAFT_415730 [Daldinia grandis]
MEIEYACACFNVRGGLAYNVPYIPTYVYVHMYLHRYLHYIHEPTYISLLVYGLTPVLYIHIYYIEFQKRFALHDWVILEPLSRIIPRH